MTEARGPDSIVGRRIANRFVIEAPIGSGGMGRIYRARDSRGGASVALKLLKRALLDDDIVRERFRREALSLSNLHHPGIVGVIDFGETDDGDLYTSLELVEGATLASILEGGPLEPPRAATIFDQILDALSFCHAAEVVHRDLKPSNIMITTKHGAERVKLIDFGLVHVSRPGADTLTETGAVHGTPLYMAPEQCRGEEVGPKTDVYAAGVLFYEALAGTPPFRGNDAATFMAQHLFVDAPALGSVAPHVPAGIAHVVHTALAKRPEDRPTALELRVSLAEAVAGRGPVAHADALAEQRNRVAGLTREERVLGTAMLSGESRHAPKMPKMVAVWMPADERSASIRGALGAAGMPSVAWVDEQVGARDDVDAVVLRMRDAERRIPIIEAQCGKLPIIVVDVGSPEETSLVIRLGAVDMALTGAPDAELPKKILRGLKRRWALR